MGTWWMEHHLWMFVNYEAMAARNEGNPRDKKRGTSEKKREAQARCRPSTVMLDGCSSWMTTSWRWMFDVLIYTHQSWKWRFCHFRSPRRPDLGGLKGKKPPEVNVRQTTSKITTFQDRGIPIAVLFLIQQIIRENPSLKTIRCGAYLSYNQYDT